MASRPFAPTFVAVRLMLASDSPLVWISVLLASVFIRIFVGALVVQSMWNWFITPIWPRQITYPEALGLTLILMFCIVFVRGFQLIEPKRRPTTDLWALVKPGYLHLSAMFIFWFFAAGFRVFLYGKL